MTQEPRAPIAAVRRERRFAWIWLLPLAALALAGWLGRQAWFERGREVTVRFEAGHGIAAGDPLLHLGIQVGEVTAVELAPELDAVAVRLRLDPAATAMARAGTRFWVVRPHVTLDGVAGLETLLGARYVAVAPGPTDAEEATEFVGLETPPLGDVLEPGGLEIQLEAPRRFGLAPGAPVFYRQVQVGVVLGVALSSDATAVEARVRIRPSYVPLVRANTRFWQVTGIDMKLALTEGFSLELESLRTLISGGIAFATPDEPGDPVRSGHVFPLDESYEDDWLEWRPAIPIGALSATGVPLPKPVFALLAWQEGVFLTSDEERLGCVLELETGVIGPRDLFRTPADADEGTAGLAAAGRALPLDVEPIWEASGLALVPGDLAGRTPWPRRWMRVPSEPEDCVVVGTTAAPKALSARWLEKTPTSWQVDKAFSFDARWHGACVVARSDGALVGLLLVEKGRGFVAPIAAPLTQ